jgi:hypothetical protein
MSQNLMIKNPRRALENIVSALNGKNALLKGEDHAALVRFVEAWNQAGRNVCKMTISKADAERFSLPNLEKVWRLILLPITWPKSPEFGAVNWSIAPYGENRRDIAAFCVSMLLTNPLRGKLCDAPCQRVRCGKWFIKRRTLQKCCSRGCTVIVKAGITTSGERKEKHGQHIKRARKAIREWKTSHGDWREFVSKRTGLTVKWVSRNTANKKYPHRELRQPGRRAHSKTSARKTKGEKR